MAILDRITHISFPDMENEALHDLTTGIASGSMSLDELLVQGNISLGECNANKLEVQIFGLDDVSNKKIKVWQTDLNGENLKNIFLFFIFLFFICYKKINLALHKNQRNLYELNE